MPLARVPGPLARMLATHRRFFTNWKFLHQASKRAAPALETTPPSATFIPASHIAETGVTVGDELPPAESLPPSPASGASLDPIERALQRAAKRAAKKNGTTVDAEFARLKAASPPAKNGFTYFRWQEEEDDEDEDDDEDDDDEDDDGFRVVEMESE